VLLLPGRATCPAEDYLTEARAQAAFDGRAVLPDITVPVLLISGDRDPYCPREVVQQTADLIPGSALVWYEGAGHLAAVSSHRIPQDVLAFASPG
jgi:pimeloyl-ACP methyl ester carboxylesterase